MKQIDKVRDYFSKTPVGDINSVKKLVGSSEYAYLILNILMNRNEINRITRGYYSVHKDPEVAVYCFKPSYIGLHDSMSFHNMWEQETAPVIITTRKIRPGPRKMAGSNVILRRINPRYFFGFGYFKSGDLAVPVSDVEKTFIDFFYFREMRKDTMKLFTKRLDVKKLNGYLKRYPNNFRNRVMEALGKQ